jgi:Cu+-exporting ATPase
MNSRVELKVDGMTCDTCVRSVTFKLLRVKGVSSAAVDLASGKATVEYDEDGANVDGLIAAVEQIGFHAARL